MDKITESRLNRMGACQEGIDWVLSCKTSDPIELMKIAQKSNNIEIMRYAIWGFARITNKRNKIKFAVYCAEKVIHIFEDKYPEDKRPRKAIQAAKRYMKNMTEENRRVASDAASAAYAAWAAADAGVDSAAWAAWAAWGAADADAAVAADAADATADAAAAAYAASKKELYKKFISYGIKILKEGE